VSDEGRIPTDGLRFRQPLAELEEILQVKIRRAEDAGDREAAALYEKVLHLAREKAESLGLGGKENPTAGGEGASA
jgi:hypothetical protein